MQQDLISALLIPGLLAIMMIGMGTTLTRADFSLLLHNPKAVLIGLLLQILVLPLLGLLLVQWCAVPPLFAVGIMIICLCPGGAGSNLLVLLARADSALSVTLTAVSNLLLIFSLPWLINAVLAHYLGIEHAPQLPVIHTLLTTVAITVLPVLAGMLMRHFYPEFCQRSEAKFRWVSAGFLLTLMLGVAIKNPELIGDALYTLAPVVFALNIAASLVGFTVATVMGLAFKQRITLAIETGFQNAALAIVITGSFLNDTTMALPATIYGGVMFIGASLMVGFSRVTLKAS